MGTGFFAAFLEGVAFAGAFFAGALDTGLAAFLGSAFLAVFFTGAFFFAAGFLAVFLAVVGFARPLTGFFGVGFATFLAAVFFFAPVALDCAGFLALLADAFFVAFFFATVFLLFAVAIPFISIGRRYISPYAPRRKSRVIRRTAQKCFTKEPPCQSAGSI
ncbi:MAG: hypothetical protein QF721_12200 [Verrucomicrobiota bacterium]|nr:hypothetical protein [Verrucomicrobiota bacterium]MDP7050207.1 hypothetical protein [Verrucomicrobiota bacterium]